LSFWDYAAAAPYVPIRMTAPESAPAAYKDAVFISPHKFIGGPSTPGVLVVRRDLMNNSVPAVVGGGTVAFVNPESHEYLADVVQREEGGTPAIVESIRAGLVFQLKDAVGSETIEQLEADFVRRAITALQEIAGVEILGSTEVDRLSIVSFTVRSPRGSYLHHNFVVAVLSDLFGIQSRGGCSCAGPYGHRLLGIDLEASQEFEQEIGRGCEGIKPGWTRVNFNYFLDEEVFRYIIHAIGITAALGHRLLPQYDFDPATGVWRHKEGAKESPMSLRDVRYVNGRPELPPELPQAGVEALAGYLTEGQRILAGLPEPGENPESGQFSADFEALRWFEIPPESVFDS
jgi:selenocysteine lyase/cysteine desulfurase